MSNEEIIKIAILAVGGQGGAVLTNWLVDVADRGATPFSLHRWQALRSAQGNYLLY